MGYGSRALKALQAYYSGAYFTFSEDVEPQIVSCCFLLKVSPQLLFKAESSRLKHDKIAAGTTLLDEPSPTVRSPHSMPPLLQRLQDIKPEPVEWLGVSFGLTGPLLRFVVPYFLSQI